MKRTLLIIAVLLDPWNICHGMLAAKLARLGKHLPKATVVQKRAYGSKLKTDKGFGVTQSLGIPGSLTRNYTSKKLTQNVYLHEIKIDYLMSSSNWYFDPIGDEDTLKKIFKWHQSRKQNLIIHPVSKKGDHLAWHMLKQKLIEPHLVYLNDLGTNYALDEGDDIFLPIILLGAENILSKLDGSPDQIDISTKNHKLSSESKSERYDAIDVHVSDETTYMKLNKDCKRISLLQIGDSTFRNLFDDEDDYIDRSDPFYLANSRDKSIHDR